MNPAFATLCFSVLGLMAAACASDPEVIESTGASTTSPSDSATTPEPDTDPISTTTTSTSVTTTSAPTATTPPPSSDTSAAPATTRPPGAITPIGDFQTPEGEFVKITDIEDPNAECSSGLLATRSEGEIGHVYEELGEVLALELIDGFYGQAVMVESCEESLLRLLFTTTSVLPDDGFPEITVGTLPEEVFHLHDYWWGRSGWFHADAVFFDGDVGWNDHVVFDSFDGSMRVFADVFGERVVLDNGIDFVVPDRWEIADGDPALDIVELVDTDSPAALSITVYPDTVPDPEPLADEELVNTAEVYVDFWEEIGDGRSRTSGTGRTVIDHLFGGSEGTRLVRTVDLDDRAVRIVAFTPIAAGAVDELVPTLALEQVRLYSAVG